MIELMTLRELLSEKQMTVKELSKRTGIPATTLYSSADKRLGNLKIDLLRKIVNALGVNITNFLPDYSSFKENLVQESPLLSAMKRSGFDNSLSKDFLKMRMLEELDITEDKEELIYTYNRLNVAGKSKAREYVKDLTQIPDYTKKDPDQQTE